ncbi:CDP-glycerol glycerophosphotransferase family protein [Sphaerisporangium perillae]|uniref:CDP-glycerol glycerophosphotransferase family protein n=1 Tax=Sphaerisporangium perillae TaxID=2935860 RepID=UPI00200E185B|nr:CDP-glycerol glycerophosphotransferase family protein [Sphaerisporangium perillae]
MTGYGTIIAGDTTGGPSMGWVRRNVRGAFLGGLLLLSFPALFLTALYPFPAGFAVAAAVSYGAEVAAGRLALPVVDRLGRLHLGLSVRFLAREIAAVLLVARVEGAGSGWFVLLCCGLLLVHALRAAQAGAAVYLDHCLNRMPVMTRNLDVSDLRIPEEPLGGLAGRHGVRLFSTGVLPVGAIAVGAITGRYVPGLGADGAGAAAGGSWLSGAGPSLTGLGVGGVGAAIVLQVAALLLSLPLARLAAPLARRERVIGVVDRQVQAYRPEVIFYFSGAPTSVYQATMWLDTLARLSRRTIVVLRERELLPLLGPTPLPVLCVPSAVDLMNLRGLDGARLALYASNVGKNIHLLRVPGLRSVFIGHGDSDKEASFNPFSKVYDEVWVAGPAGRDRYLRAQVGVRDENIVEVGRPQLSGIRRSGPGLEALSVLYAPTWEGWTEDLFHTSLITMGPRIVRTLLGHLPAVRLIYKPHPLTGERDPRAGTAHRKIVAMIEAAAPEAGHRIVTGPEPHLYACFNDCDLLITDISSVVADFVAGGKPYAVTNVAGMAGHVFRERYPSAEAAYLLGPDLRELPSVLAQPRGTGEDDLARARRRMKSYLLGPDHPDAMTRFDDAVNRALDRTPDRAALQRAASALEPRA